MIYYKNAKMPSRKRKEKENKKKTQEIAFCKQTFYCRLYLPYFFEQVKPMFSAH